MLIIVGIAGFLLLNAWLDAGERRESSYGSLSGAKKDGAIALGWLPDFLLFLVGGADFFIEHTSSPKVFSAYPAFSAVQS